MAFDDIFATISVDISYELGWFVDHYFTLLPICMNMMAGIVGSLIRFDYLGVILHVYLCTLGLICRLSCLTELYEFCFIFWASPKLFFLKFFFVRFVSALEGSVEMRTSKLPLLKVLRTVAGRIEPINLIATIEQLVISLQYIVLLFFCCFSC
jgi:hypothetical protein